MRDNDPANLLDLIGLGLAATGLEIQDLRHAVPGVDVVIAPDTLDKSQMEQQRRGGHRSGCSRLKYLIDLGAVRGDRILALFEEPIIPERACDRVPGIFLGCVDLQGSVDHTTDRHEREPEIVMSIPIGGELSRLRHSFGRNS